MIQKDSEEQKNIELRKRIAELERIVGQKQMEVDFLNKLIEFGSQEVKVDIKKKFGGKLSNGSPPSKRIPLENESFLFDVEDEQTKT